MVGVLGGFTTFSAFSLETLTLARSGEWLGASANVMFSVLLCLAAVWLGYAAAGRRSIADALLVAASGALPINFAAERCRSGRTGSTRNFLPSTFGPVLLALAHLSLLAKQPELSLLANFLCTSPYLCVDC